MRRFAWAILLILLAGCSDDPSDASKIDPTTSNTTSTTSTTSTTQTGTTGPGNDPSEPGENLPPSATVTASIGQGEIPVNVSFELTGEDPEGATLAWTFDADGDGSVDVEGAELPAIYEHSYTEVGTYTAMFTVGDGEHTVTRNVTINATAAAAAPPSFETIVISGAISGLYAADPVLGLGAGYITDPNEHEFEVQGVASAMHFLLEWDDFGYDLDFDILAPDGSEAASAANYNDPVIGDGAQSESAETTDGGMLNQVGTWKAIIHSAGSYESEYTMTITFTP